MTDDAQPLRSGQDVSHEVRLYPGEFVIPFRLWDDWNAGRIKLEPVPGTGGPLRPLRIVQAAEERDDA